MLSKAGMCTTRMNREKVSVKELLAENEIKRHTVFHPYDIGNGAGGHLFTHLSLVDVSSHTVHTLPVLL